MHVKLYLTGFALFTIGQLVSTEQMSLPHESCWYQQQYMALACIRYNLVFPDNFDVGKIPSNIVDIRLECPSARLAIASSDYYCNMMKASAKPFPALPQLVSVSLHGFKGEGEGSFPVNQLLTSVKQHVENLDVSYSKIGSLDREVLAGFSALKTLTLSGNDITSVALDAFQSLPALQEIHLGRNKITEFDWSALQPVADTLIELGMVSQKPPLQKLHRSGPGFTLKKLSWLTLFKNGLSSIPTEVLNTIPLLAMRSDNNSLVWLEANPFCPDNPDCSCCEMKGFFTWLDGVTKAAKPGQEIKVEYSCGSPDQGSLHQLLVNNGVVEYKVGANADSLMAAEFKPSVVCATVPAVVTTVKTSGADQHDAANV